MKEKELIFMEHDGAIDDLLSQLLLLSMEEKEVIGINVTPADSFLVSGINSTYKLLHLLGRINVPIGRSDHKAIHAFPNEWRAKAAIINALPMLINLPDPSGIYELKEASDLLVEQLSAANQPVTILITGPCSNVVNALKKAPEIKEKIKRIVWMAGAFYVAGNVQSFEHDGTAEWNIYWDPESAKELIEMELNLICIPLDVTDKVAVTKEFLSQLAYQSSYRLSNLASQFWALTMDTIPCYHYTYFMWDVLATSYMAIPEAFTMEKVQVTVSTRPPNAGQTMVGNAGKEVTIATGVNQETFLQYLLKQLGQD